MTDRLRALWDFGDLEASEARFREQLGREPDDEGRAEVLTQLARVEGLRGDFEAAERLIVEAEGLAGEGPRIPLERGRSLRSSGNPAAAFPLFVSAFELALAANEDFIAADAAHMAALVDPEGIEPWTQRGIDLAERSDGAAYWLGPLLNNLGWHRLEVGDAAGALDAFERALEARQRDPERPGEIALARYGVARGLREVGRPDEAAAQAELAVGWASGVAAPDGWFHEELAEDYAALGREADAREQARLAIPLLERDDPEFGDERAERLRSLARV